MTKKIDVAVIGATGIIAEALIDILEQRNFPVEKFYPLETSDAVGERVTFKGSSITTQDAFGFDFSAVQLVFLAGEKILNAEIITRVVETGCFIIDAGLHTSLEQSLPPIIAGVNDNLITSYVDNRIITNPSCTSILLWRVLKPIYDYMGIERVDATVLKAVSGSGRGGVEELAGQTANLLNARPITSKVFPAQIAFNVLPVIGDMQDTGFTTDEIKIIAESKSILGDDSIIINPALLTVPVFFGDNLVLNLICRDPCDIEEVESLWNQVNGVKFFVDSADNSPTAVTMAAGIDTIHVSRVRRDPVDPRGLTLCLVADCTRAGIAINSVQIAEILVKSYL